MKKLIIHPFLSGLLIVCLLFLVSCKKDKAEKNLPPELTAVTDLLQRNISLASVNYGDWIIIKGKNLATTYKVEFNTILAPDSLIYADDTSVTVKIPAVLPDPANNPITVTTKYGSATLNFQILQPPPTITGFDPMAGPQGQVVTITGYNFGGVTSVKFGTIDATIVSSTREEIKVNVPAGVTSAFINVTTQSGTTTSAYRYGLSYEVFTDALPAGWSFSPSSANVTYNATNTTPVKRGTNSLKIIFNAGFSYLRLVKAAAISTTGHQGVKFSMYAPDAFLNKKVRVYLNNNSAPGSYTITVTKVNEWVNYEIPLINFGSPTTLTHVVFNEFSGSVTPYPREIYVDDVGLY